MRREKYNNGQLIGVEETEDDPRDIRFNASIARLKQAYRADTTFNAGQLTQIVKDIMVVMRHLVEIDGD